MVGMKLELDRSRSDGLTVQLVDALAGSIARGELALGERLPAERGLAGRSVSAGRRW